VLDGTEETKTIVDEPHQRLGEDVEDVEAHTRRKCRHEIAVLVGDADIGTGDDSGPIGGHARVYESDQEIPVAIQRWLEPCRQSRRALLGEDGKQAR
jgi:hypothetical protein